ncbi:MAG: 4a-hydroxytetrahydrobiopterin dehydratase [Gammaproteobacteria bacterium]|nr:4a-hydroxytetrahydrobiopterin dehydratase [Gammaproteobacteria bacterium]
MDEPASELAREDCVACRPGSPKVTAEEAAGLLADLPDWTIASVAGIDRLTCRFAFPSFAKALAFANRVGELADAADHHPEITVEWGAATVSWWTHTIGGLHRNDFIMAARTTQAGR